MSINLNIMCFISKIIIITIMTLVAFSSVDANQRVLDELASEEPDIPLRNAMGEEAYNDAIGTGKYRYVGNSKCRLCHRKFFIGRKTDPHDHAMESLILSGHENNSHCLKCHSTGHGMKTGFVDMKTTPRLSNVQCEGCHGPGNVHIDLAKSKNRTSRFYEGGFLAGQDNPKILRNMCTSCHTKRWNRSYHDLTKAYDSYKKADPRSGGHSD